MSNTDISVPNHSSLIPGYRGNSLGTRLQVSARLSVYW